MMGSYEAPELEVVESQDDVTASSETEMGA